VKPLCREAAIARNFVKGSIRSARSGPSEPIEDTHTEASTTQRRVRSRLCADKYADVMHVDEVIAHLESLTRASNAA
jgi:hypothetical protein